MNDTTHTAALAERLAALSPSGRMMLAARLQVGNTKAESTDVRLVAYVVPAAGSTVDSVELRDYLNTRLPAYMVPSMIVAVDAMPLTPNGKLDRQALPDPVPLVMPAAGGVVAPRNELEQGLAALWEGLLGTSSLSINDDFFELGGHSLLVARLVAQVRERYNVEVPVVSFFQQPTIAGLAEHIATIQWATTGVRVQADPDHDEVEL
jgi:acyl carrier protein